MNLMALAIAKPTRPTARRSARRSTHEVDGYDDLIKKYAKPFTPQNKRADGRRLHLHLLQGKARSCR